MNIKTITSDHLGVFTSVTCMLHCFATPLLFITQAQNSTLIHEVPFFLAINELFVYHNLFGSNNTFNTKLH